MVKLIPVQKPDQILPKYRNTPIERLFLYHNLREKLPPTSIHAELLIGMCMDNRKDLIIPNEFAYELKGTVVHAHKLGNSFGMIIKTKGGPNAILRSGSIKALDSYFKRVRENQS